MKSLNRPLMAGLMLASAILPVAALADTIKIAFIDPLSGPFAPVGQNTFRSFQISAEIANLWRSELGDIATIHTKSEAIAAGLFGAPMPDKFADRAGDLIAIVNTNAILINPEKEKLESAMLGHHGGLTQVETNVPLQMLVI